MCRFYHTHSPTSPHIHLGHWGTCRTVTPVYLFPPRTRRPPGYSTSPRQRAAGPHHLHVVYQQGAPSSSRRGESPMVPGPDCMENGRMCPNGIHYAAKGCVTMLPAEGRQHRGCIILQAVTHSLVFLKMGKIISWNMLSWLELLISRYCCI